MSPLSLLPVLIVLSCNSPPVYSTPASNCCCSISRKPLHSNMTVPNDGFGSQAPTILSVANRIQEERKILEKDLPGKRSGIEKQKGLEKAAKLQSLKNCNCTDVLLQQNRQLPPRSRKGCCPMLTCCSQGQLIGSIFNIYGGKWNLQPIRPSIDTDHRISYCLGGGTKWRGHYPSTSIGAVYIEKRLKSNVITSILSQYGRGSKS